MGATIASPTIASPAWYQELSQAYGSGEAHAFILSGDTAGYVEQTRTLRGYLEEVLSRPRNEARRDGIESILVRYDRASGVTFGSPEQERRAIALVTGKEAGAKPASPTAAALGAIGGSLPGAGNPFASTQPLAALTAIDKLVRASGGVNQVSVVIDEAQTICPAADVATMSGEDRTLLVLLKTWARDERVARTKAIIVLLVGDLTELHPDLRAASGGWRSVLVPLPDQARREGFIAWWLAQRAAKGRAVDLDGLTVEQLARATAGLNLRGVEDVLLRGAKAGAVTAGIVKARKDEIIRSEYAEVAEMLEPLPGGLEDVGGLDFVKGWLARRLLGPIEAGRTADVPKGLLLVGPPGTGKTYLARGIAGATRMNAIQIRMEKVQDSLVGASERKMARVLGFALALAPTIIFVDELDQTDIGTRGDTSGNPVAKNLFNQLLTFLGDEVIRGRVVLIAASNRPEKLDPALLRSGRMDAILPVLLPGMADRAAIAARHLLSRGMDLSRCATGMLAAGTERYSSADVAAVVGEAVLLARDEGRDYISPADVEAALADVLPSVSPQQNDQYTRLAIAACNRRSLLPPEWRDRMEAARETATAESGGGRWEWAEERSL
jgi:hypothetical protein